VSSGLKFGSRATTERWHVGSTAGIQRI